MFNFKLALIVLVNLDALRLLSMVSAGHGLIGYGYKLYDPICAYTCREVFSTSRLNCSEPVDPEATDEEAEVETSPECYATDDTFLQSLAYCMSTHCQDVALWDLEEYWSKYVADYEPNQATPKATYQQVSLNITTEPTVTLVMGEDLNKTMLASDEDYEAAYNGMSNFEQMEINDSTHGCVTARTLKS